MSGKARRKVDRRVVRTRNVLGDALLGLMLEKPFEDIRVEDVLDRASVSRSTFYGHYLGKEDLFAGDIEDFWEWMASSLDRNGDSSTRIAPVRELLTHVAEARALRDALARSGKLREVLETGQAHLSRAIARRLEARAAPHSTVAPVAQALAGALLALLTWWMDHDMPETPEQMDMLFHRLFAPAVVGGSHRHGNAAAGHR